MSLHVPQKFGLLYESSFTAGDATFGTSVTTGATSSSKGSVTQLIASTGFDAFFVVVTCSEIHAANTASATCVDIYADDTEIIIPDLLAGGAGTASGLQAAFKTWWFPLYVKSGTKISAAAASDRTSTAMRVLVELYGGTSFPPCRVAQKVTTYGIGTLPSGTTITPGTGGAEGSWTQITSSTSADHWGVVPSLQMATGDAAWHNRTMNADIGIGAASSEEQIGEGYWWHVSAGENFNGALNPMPLIQDIPSGTRLAMRVSNNGPDIGDLEGALHCLS